MCECERKYTFNNVMHNFGQLTFQIYQSLLRIKTTDLELLSIWNHWVTLLRVTRGTELGLILAMEIG